MYVHEKIVCSRRAMAFLIVLYIIAAMSITLAPVAPQALRGCPDRCGDVSINYPFGIGDACSMERKFNMTCSVSDGTTPKAYLETSTINITDIFVESGEIRILKFISRDCYRNAGPRDKSKSNNPTIRFRRSFAVSSSRNKFFAIGCDTYAIIQGSNHQGMVTTGCMSLCTSAGLVIEESCSGVGCCEVSVPKELSNGTVRLSSYYNHTSVFDFNPCSYAFMVESEKFNFAGVSSFTALDKEVKLPLIVDWSVGDQSCDEAISTRNVSYCTGNSRCVNSKTGIGYLCKCLTGYQGNPYHPDGCQDIDECKLSQYCNGTCINTPGNYICTCQKGFKLTNGTLCIENAKSNGPGTIVYVLSGVSVGIVVLVFVSSMLFWVNKKRKMMKLKEKFFEQNGGLLLQMRLSAVHDVGSLETAKIFTEEELIVATNNYDHIIGEGGYGLVYKGVLPDKRVVAIKKPKLGAQTQATNQIEQFVNEVILLMQINHRNVVRLLGCCLDTEVPILVYEFISNGTLFEHLHKKGSNERPLSWELRLKIAIETAISLAYLHYEINTPIVHRDVKTMNILLDESYTAKVSDFGTSKLFPLDEEQLSTLVQGTIGYLDPEYLQSSQLTEKSDVYSFGVVLAELLTSKKAFSFDKSEGTTSNLAMSFLSLKEDQLRTAIDSEIDFETNIEAIRQVSNLAKRCLRIKSDERPTMKEVAMELQGLIATTKHPWERVNHSHTEESDYLVGSPSNNRTYDYDLETGSICTTGTTMYDTIQKQMILPYNDGR